MDATTFVLDLLDHFAVEMLRNEFITTIIPALKAEVENSGNTMNGDHHDYNLYVIILIIGGGALIKVCVFLKWSQH